MDDLISRQAAIDALWKEPLYLDPLNVLTEARDRIESLPSAERRGRWMLRKICEDEYGNETYKLFCSECGSPAYEFFQPYCHKCGARMKNEEVDGFED